MMKNKQRLPYLLSLLIGLILLVTACGPSKAERLNNEGNEAFTQQAFQDALVAYQSAQIDEPELAEPYYNAANALYRQGAYDAALEQMQLALSYANADSLAQAGYYNLGNTSYSQQDLQAAIDAYTQALLLNPNDQDAKYNLELALQQQQQQQNEEEQQQEQQDQQDQQDQSEDGQSEEEQQQDQNADQQEGEGQEQPEQQQEGQDEQQQQQDQQGQESDQGEQSQESQEQQQEGQEGDQQSEDQAQDQAGQGQPQDGQPQEEQPGQLNQMPQPGQRMTAEQAEQLLAAIARDGQTLQEKLGQIFAVPWAPPVQDW